jgi:chromosome segregation ATPase
VSVDSSTMVIITAVGTAGATAGGILWRALVRLNRSTITALNRQNQRLERRTKECEEDRKLLHGRLNEQGERITKLSEKIGRLEGQIRNTKT